LLKQSLVFFLIVTLVAPFAGTFIYLQVQKSKVRKEVKHRLIAGLHQDQLVKLTFSPHQTQTELRWKHAKEFEYRGEMYDIVSTQQQGDSIVYHCWWDHEETALCQQLNTLAAVAWANNPFQQKHSAHLLTFAKSLFLSKIQPVFVASCAAVKPMYNVGYFDYTSRAIAPPAPPPDGQEFRVTT
jgi:hypothetical protein